MGAGVSSAAAWQTRARRPRSKTASGRGRPTLYFVCRLVLARRCASFCARNAHHVGEELVQVLLDRLDAFQRFTGRQLVRSGEMAHGVELSNAKPQSLGV